jgi:hypothetical protein
MGSEASGRSVGWREAFEVLLAVAKGSSVEEIRAQLPGFRRAYREFHRAAWLAKKRSRLTRRPPDGWVEVDGGILADPELEEAVRTLVIAARTNPLLKGARRIGFYHAGKKLRDMAWKLLVYLPKEA